MAPEEIVVHACLGHRAHRGEGDVAGGFEDGRGHWSARRRGAGRPAPCCRAGSCRRRATGLSCNWVEIVDLDFHLQHVAGVGAHALDSRLDAAGGDEVVVLDQHGVVEAEAVVEAAAAAYGVFLEQAQARRCFARADDAAPSCRPRRRPAHARRWATPERWPVKFSATRSAVRMARAAPSMVAMPAPADAIAAVGDFDGEGESGIDQAERGLCGDQAGDNARLARDERGADAFFPRER